MTETPGGYSDLDSYRAFQDGTEDDPDTPKRNRRLWFGFVIIAFLIFELTANPSLALAFGCIKFGWGDFRRARRLKRDDPSRIRGKVCARFATAWGLVKVSLVSTALMFTILFITKAQGGPVPNVPPPTWVTAFMLALAGFGLSAFVSSFAVISALRHGLKVWVGAGENRAKFVLACAIITWVTLVGGVLLVVTLAPREWAGLSPHVFLAVLVGLMVAIPVAILVLLEALERRVVAKTPLECWGELPAHLLLNPSAADDWERDDLRARDLDTFGRSW